MRTFLFWLGILFALDALIGLTGLRYWQRLLPNIHVERIAMIEAAAAFVLLAAWFTLGGHAS